jgi:hypothetical protein
LELLSEIFNEGGIKIISLSNIRPIIIYFHSSQCRLIPYLHQRPIFFKAKSSIVAILELIRGAQCLIEVIRSSGEEIWHVDEYQIPYYSGGIEGEKRTHPRFADCLFGKAFAHVRNCLRKEKHMYGTNKNIDGFYTKTTQIWGFRVKIQRKSVIPT